jgi:hypothetical protein
MSAAPPSALLEQWARTVQDVARGYALTFDDFLNDLDVRHALSAFPSTPELDALDAQFRTHSYPAGGCVWGVENAAAENWDKDTHWYYWRLPRAPGPAFGE